MRRGMGIWVLGLLLFFQLDWIPKAAADGLPDKPDPATKDQPKWVLKYECNVYYTLTGVPCRNNSPRGPYVQIDLKIEPSGKLLSAKITKSSGRPIIDEPILTRKRSLF
jgi:hypothetical protein